MTEMWQGSSKDIIYDPEVGLVFDFSDRVSVFDLGPVPCAFLGLGELRCTIATRLFHKLNTAGFRTHFRDRLTNTKMLVRAYNIPEKHRRFEGAEGRLLPLELLFRFIITKKFLGRIENGSVDRGTVEGLLAPGQTIELGARLRSPYIECSTKHQAADTYISDVAAAILADISMEVLGQVYDEVRRAADFLKLLFRQVGFDLADGKIEGAILNDGTLVITDSISPDELRLIGNDGKSYDKDPVREWYETTHPVWTNMVKQAKIAHPTNKDSWPKYMDAPPMEIVEETILRYRQVANALVVL